MADRTKPVIDLVAISEEINANTDLKADGIWCRHELKGTENEYVIVYSNNKYARMSILPTGETRQPELGTPCWPVLNIVLRYLTAGATT